MDPDEYSYSGYGIGFDSLSFFLFQILIFKKNVIVFGAENSSSMH